MESHGTATWRQAASIATALAAVAWSAGIGVHLWITPIRSTGVAMVATLDQPPTIVRVNDVRSFAQISLLGPLPLIVPVLLTALGAWAAWRRRAPVLAAALILASIFCVLGGFSIGAYYVPAAGFLLLALLAAE